MSGGHTQTGTVVALRFKRVGESDKHNHRVLALSYFNCFFQTDVAVALALHSVSVGIFVVYAVCIERVCKRYDFCSVYMARARALIARSLCQTSYDRDVL